MVSSWPLEKQCSLPHPHSVDTRPQTLLITGMHRPEDSGLASGPLHTAGPGPGNKGRVSEWKVPHPLPGHTPRAHTGPAPEETWERTRGFSAAGEISQVSRQHERSHARGQAWATTRGDRPAGGES